MRRSLLSITILPLLFAGAQAQEAERYTLEKTETGYVRMDNRTGEMSICETSDTQLICRLAADERKAREDHSDTLQTRLDKLEERVARLEDGIRGQPTTEKEFEQGLDFMERFFRRFMGIVQEFDGKDQPDRT